MQKKLVKTITYSGQKPGTSGLRKKVKVFQQPHYCENFIQAIITTALNRTKNSVLVVGGDGRYFMKEVITIIAQIAAANDISKVIIGENGLLSTPAVSHLIRKYKTAGGIVLTASHNPGGPNEDFGIKFNIETGGPAPEAVTNEIYEITQDIKNYKMVPEIKVDLTRKGLQNFDLGDQLFQVEIIDPVDDYLELMKSIFDFDKLKGLIQGSKNRRPFKMLINSMNGVTGPYVKRIFVEELGADSDNVLNVIPLEDFGGCHPDPNLTYAADLVNILKDSSYDFGAAFDGDGDRNMILGKKSFFVNPSDSLAVICDNADSIRYFKEKGVHGFARSMPTSSAVDRVAQAKNMKAFEVPTGWKFFGSLMDAELISICGEESFGTGSNHIREKDGIWAVLAWLSIIEAQGLSVQSILDKHWRKYGRNYFVRYDFENCDSQSCQRMIELLESKITNPQYIGEEYTVGAKTMKVREADNFQYVDVVDGSTSKNQGLRIVFECGSRIIFRLSGTGSSGATIRIYLEAYEKDYTKCPAEAQDALQHLIHLALDISNLEHFIGHKKPSVIT